MSSNTDRNGEHEQGERRERRRNGLGLCWLIAAVLKSSGIVDPRDTGLLVVPAFE